MIGISERDWELWRGLNIDFGGKVDIDELQRSRTQFAQKVDVVFYENTEKIGDSEYM